MFQSIGWGELFVVLVIAVIVIGPEKLPGVIEDIRAAIYAARKAIKSAKAELNGEFGAEFEEFRAPLAEVAKLRALGPKQALSKALFEEDESFLEDIDPRKLLDFSGDPTTRSAPAKSAGGTGGTGSTGSAPVPAPESAPRPTPEKPAHNNDASGLTGGFSWDDIL
ncbi:Sec-independent protein translocase protein TatB [Corynebacterium caspium]|uniref:Sec-independent protein translocase protein TatB n=1 Tax=Corynebacterium caspium TaxID=234828 RepID=UPI00036E65A3|nr:Sec-independent protein translocase protein TatB [Corynebacterium caspium]WKD59502.1 Sec-independent protein translocase protein TatB [Corynebacterium caspium DSM 44850]